MSIAKLIPGAAPVNRVASRVMRKGEHWAPKRKPTAAHVIHGEVPPVPPQPLPKGSPDIAGLKRDRMRAMYYCGNGRWVARCDCGRFEVRRGAALANRKDEPDACIECRAAHFSKSGRSYGDTRTAKEKAQDVAAHAAIQGGAGMTKAKKKATAKRVIRSVYGVRERCSQRGECWVWIGAHKAGRPIAKLDGKADSSVRRWVYAQANKATPEFVMPAYLGDSCGNGSCCNPAHLLPMSTTERSKKSAAAVANPALHRYRQALSISSKLDPQRAGAIRSDSRPAPAVARDYGISPQMVNKIKRGERWAPPPCAMSAMAAALGGIAA